MSGSTASNMSEHVAKRSPRRAECRRTITIPKGGCALDGFHYGRLCRAVAKGETYHRETVGFWRGGQIVKSFCEQCYAARVSAFDTLVRGGERSPEG